MELIMFVLVAIIGVGVLVNIKWIKQFNKPYILTPSNIHDLKSLDAYLIQDNKTILNQISKVKLEWNDCCKELKDINYDLQELYKVMKNGVTVDKSDKVSYTYEMLVNRKNQLEQDCRELKYDLRNLNRVYTIINTSV